MNGSQESMSKKLCANKVAVNTNQGQRFNQEISQSNSSIKKRSKAYADFVVDDNPVHGIYLASSWFITNLLFISAVIVQIFSVKLNFSAMQKKNRTSHLALGVPLIVLILLVNLPLVAFAQVEPAPDPLRIPADDEPGAIHDPTLKVEQIVTGLKRPTAMAFLGNSSDDIIVTEKDNGTVRRIIGGVIQPEPLVDVAVANDNDTNERGLLGMAVAQENETTTYVYLYYTESGGGQDGDDADGVVPAGNRLYRYELVQDPLSGSTQLINPKLLLDLPARPGPRYNGGPVVVSQNANGTTVYVMIGDQDHHTSQAENYGDGPPPDGTGGIMAVDPEGNPLPAPVLVSPLNTQGENGEEEEEEEENDQEDIGMLPYYYAYGIRNGFGLARDPVTGYLWDTENGPDWFDEINLVLPGFNSGWAAVQGPAAAPENEESDIEEDLVDFGGTGVYRDPEFAWQNTVGVTAITFLNSAALGQQYENDMFVGDINNGRLYHFDLSPDRTSLMFQGPLEDKVADNVDELNSVILGTGFRSISDIEVGPDGYLYLLLYGPGRIYRISPAT
ncbi:MAG: PQQ-dependent sugar dehydrogenase [Thermoproteota archaeon]|nr:PQQ-dependent sugar dehydrogenase [Thermoproteota archaeon]